MVVLKLLIYIILLDIIFCNENIKAISGQNSINDLQVIPAHIEVGTFFNGKQIVVKAEIPDCSGVIVKLVGKDEDIVLNKKGKKAFIWLNVARVTVKYVPSIYILACSDNLSEICSIAEQEKELLGYNSLKGKVVFESDNQLSGTEFNELIKFKEHNGYYCINNNMSINIASDQKLILTAALDIPSFISEGTYSVVIYCFQDGNLLDKAAANLYVEKVGLPLFITNLSKNSPALYGILAIIVALIAGGIIGLIFIKKKD